MSDAGKERKCPKCEQPFRIPRPKNAEPQAASPKKEALIPVVCGVCQTRVYATYGQIGQSMECPDCYTQNLVKEPPKTAKPSTPTLVTGMGYDMEPVQEIEVIKSRGDDLMDKAEREVEQELKNEPKIPEKPFLHGVFTYPFHLHVFPIIVGMVLAWAFALGTIKFGLGLQGYAAVVAPFLMAGGAVALALALFSTLVTWQKVFENTSNGDDESDVRPEGGMFAITDWIVDGMPIMGSFFVSFAPGCALVNALQIGPEYFLLAAFAAFFVFPVILMSMMENATILGVYSRPVLGSLREMSGTWFKFYTLSFLLFAPFCGTILALVFLSAQSVDGGMIALSLAAIFGALAFATAYFRLLGRLALIMADQILVQVFEHDVESSAGDDPVKRDREISLGV